MDRETAMPDFARKLVLHLPSVRYDQHIMTSLRQFVREIDHMAFNSADVQFRQYLDYPHKNQPLYVYKIIVICSRKFLKLH